MSKVPAGWEKKLLKDILKVGVKNGYSPNAVDYETGHWVLSLAALGDDGINTNGIKPVLLTDNVLNSRLIPGDFLVSRSNTPDKVGRSIKFRGEVKNCSYPDLMMKFRVDKNLAIENFIEQALKGSVVRQYYKSCAAGSSSSMVKINKSIVEKTPLLIPPLPEQTKIAQILSTWDKAIATTEQLIGNSQQQKKVLVQQIITGKRRLFGFSSKWPYKKIGDFIVESRIAGTTGDIAKKITIKLYGKGVISKVEKRLGSESTKYYSRKSGQFIYSKLDFLNGAFGIIPAELDGYESTLDLPAFDFKEGVCPAWFLYFVAREQFYSNNLGLANGGRKARRVNPSDLINITIKAPPFKEQQKIAAVLTAADNEIDLLQKKLAFLKQEKAALMQQLLTGKRRVKINTTEECMDA